MFENDDRHINMRIGLNIIVAALAIHWKAITYSDNDHSEAPNQLPVMDLCRRSTILRNGTATHTRKLNGN